MARHQVDSRLGAARLGLGTYRESREDHCAVGVVHEPHVQGIDVEAQGPGRREEEREQVVVHANPPGGRPRRFPVLRPNQEAGSVEDRSAEEGAANALDHEPRRVRADRVVHDGGDAIRKLARREQRGKHDHPRGHEGDEENGGGRDPLQRHHRTPGPAQGGSIGPNGRLFLIHGH